MVYSGFEAILDDGKTGGATYVDGFVAPVLPARRDDYLAMARAASVVFRDHGAMRVVETWGDDLMRGQKTDFHRAVQTEGEETVVFSWIEWPDKATRDAGMAAVMADPRMQTPPSDMPFDGKRLIYGGFAVILDA
ncbi:DUF1428 domain-containing protein [Sphingomonas sp. Leaf412]|uniref:DUF1428 domain-containing protein n=1 Tax=Sphingomonas sp. Leaf412 TaxID=1736370 RepID=UPI002AA2B2C6|nr:DUF1428 domain-containing protein [Sphingomonas sp. Leaf412]